MMRRLVVTFSALVLAAGLSVVVMTATATAQDDQPIYPVVNCVVHTYDQTVDSSGNPTVEEEITAIFGYNNANGDQVLIPVGGLSNFLFPPPINQGQPSALDPGIHNDVFQATFDPATTPSLTWWLPPLSATATADSPNCTPGFRGAWDSSSVYINGDTVSSGGSLWSATALNSGVTPSVNASQWQLLVAGATSATPTRVTGTPVVASVRPGHSVQATATCPSGTSVTAGGGTVSGTAGTPALNGSYPQDAATWAVSAVDPAAGKLTLTAYAICTPSG